MCGIVAEHGGSDPDQLERMLERLAHRGPDDRGAVQVDGSWLGHRRLSIVDVGGGRQPLLHAPTRARAWSATARSTTTRRSARGSATASC